MTLRTKSTAQWTTAHCWIPNNNETRPTNRAAVDKIDIMHLGPSWCPYIFLLLFSVGWDWVHLVRRHYWPILQAPDGRWRWLWSNCWNEVWQGKPKYSEKTYPSTTLPTTNPTWPDLGSNLGRRGEKPATNHLSYGAAITRTIIFLKIPPMEFLSGEMISIN
jgi:hypothetical protein